MKERFINQQIEGVDKVPDAIQEYCRHEYPVERIHLSEEISIARTTNIYQALPYIDRITELLNNNLMESYDRQSSSKLLRSEKILDDGRVIDNLSIWNGGAFLLFDGNTLIGASLAREEILVTDEGNQKTGRGFGLFAVVDEEHRTGIWGILLSSIAIDSLLRKGCDVVRGSTSIHNKLADKLFSRVAKERWIEGDWVRYNVDEEKFKKSFYGLLESRGLKAQYDLIFE